jgi:hypothetical protein
MRNILILSIVGIFFYGCKTAEVKTIPVVDFPSIYSAYKNGYEAGRIAGWERGFQNGILKEKYRYREPVIIEKIIEKTIDRPYPVYRIYQPKVNNISDIKDVNDERVK